MTSATLLPTSPAKVGSLQIVPFAHPQGCRTYLVADPTSKQALAIDVHLDLVEAVGAHVKAQGWTLPYVVDTHTHADHPSGAGAIAPHFSSTRIAHEKAQHAGVTRHPKDGDTLHLGDQVITVRHAPGHTPDHIVLLTDGALFSGDTLFIGGVARTDFLGGDAGQLHDSIHAIIKDLPDDTVVYPGHDYQKQIETTIGKEKQGNPWLSMSREDFIKHLTANPPPRPANMDHLLRLNREGVDIPATISATETKRWVEAGGAPSVIDVRMAPEYETAHIPGSRLITLDQIKDRVDEVRATPAPRLILCRSGKRAGMAAEMLKQLDVGGVAVIEGGILAYADAGGETAKLRERMSIERQVRIGAGGISLVGVALAAFVSPWFLVIPAFIGAGQVFAGVTDWCGMGLMLAKMPWNRADPSLGAAPGGGGCAADLPAACAATAPPAACAATPPSDD